MSEETCRGTFRTEHLPEDRVATGLYSTSKRVTFGKESVARLHRTSSSSEAVPKQPLGDLRCHGRARRSVPGKGPWFWGSAVIIQTAKLSILISMTNRQTSDHFLMWLANRVKNKLKTLCDLCDSYTFHCTLTDGFIFLTSVTLLVRICCPSQWKSDLT